MKTLRLSHPGTIDPAAVVGALRSLLSSQTARFRPGGPRSMICLEVWATDRGIDHYITVTQPEAAIAALTAALPGVRAEDAERPVDKLTGSSSGIQLAGPKSGMVRTDIASDTATALLASMSTVGRGEHLVLQWLIAPIRRTQWSTLLNPPHDADKTDRAKRSEAEVVAAGRVAAWARTPRRASSLVASTARAARSVSGPDGAMSQRRSRRVAQSVERIRSPTMVWPSHMNVTELSPLVGWPMSPTPIRGLSRGANRLLPPPSGAPQRGPSVGVTTYPATSDQIRLGTSGRLRHLHVIGPTGVGKTTLLTRLIKADIAAGRGVIVFDPLGDLTDRVCAYVPESRVDDVVVVDPTERDLPVGLNVLRGGDVYRNVDFLVGVMARLFASSWGPRTADILRSGLLTLAQNPRFTIADLPDLLTNPVFRQRATAAVMGDRLLAGFWTWYEGLSEAERNAVIAPVLNKIRSVVLRPEAIRALCHRDGRLDLSEVFTQRRIVVVRLAKGLVGEDTAGLIGGLMLAKLWHTILARAEIDPARRHPVFVYVDEFQDYLRLPVGMGDMLAQARGMGVGMVVAHQHLGQLGDQMRRDVLANVGSRVVFQTTADDSRILARDFEPHLTPSDLRGLGHREIAVRIATPDQILPPFTGRTEPPQPAVSDPTIVKARSPQLYGSAVAKPEDNGMPDAPVGRRMRNRSQP